jgi:Na+-translocating ferredoxin:NAD+ oxidoreductase subunit B
VLIIYAIVALGLIGLLFGLLLAVVARKFAVQTDPRVEAVKEILPGANCGACGYAGCSNFAEAVVQGDTKTSGCIPGGEETAKAIAEVLGEEVTAEAQPVATVFCIGDCYKTTDRYVYDGVEDCVVANEFVGGFKSCSYGCLGFGNCVKACLFDAIKMGSHGLPVVDPEKCTGCGLCASACPRFIIQMLPKGSEGHLVLCSSHDRGKTVSRACEIGCIACKACIKACPQEAIEMDEFLAVIDLEKCDDCGECVKVCKPGTIHRRSEIPSEEDAEVAAAEKVAESA